MYVFFFFKQKFTYLVTLLAISCKDHRRTGDSAKKEEVSSDDEVDAEKKAQDSEESGSI
jgi:hypothetical protein